MYSIIIAILFFILSGWLFKKEWGKDPTARNVWSILAAILSMVMGVAVTLVWLTQILF